MGKVVKLSMADMKALLPPVPVLATESLQQFEKIFDQLVASLKCQDMVELIYIRDFALAAWEEARYTRHRVVAFDRKFKDVVAGEVPDHRDPNVRQKAVAERLAEYLPYRPQDIGHLVELEDKVMEAADDVTALLKRTPAELAYNKALERNIGLHKDLEFLITSIRKRRNEALEMLDWYRQSLGKRAEQIMADILDAEFNLVPNQAVENQLPQIASSLAPAPAQAEHHGVADHRARIEPDAAANSVTGPQDDDEDEDGSDD
jgi:phytoene dehydrogenase-like protein